MTTVTIMPSGSKIEATAGASLLSLILASDERIQHNCDGKATCGTCHIFVLEGRKGVSKIAREENEKLDAVVGVGSKSRLACQAFFLGTEDVTVEVLSFR
ncbi:2Fe-2S ferredoxin [Novosphingobium sp. Rr 2-17]|uniref:2Fe-2S iron-sulfur cluster-binding protein n=1 Tax=Novosphingobium sp. Rr 2-17 TaxID=555793 RepID=UPI000269A240|nr:2Fe-2S iron-sulfur cluster-binding protein [Novosphingobium sp. Rr 2-17]EIZ77316.1 2Fe-2S ferredoxin [Novosphingobium sp. Rr 2-17]